jgi:DNA-directed RNA polymerase specialized sigma24 family protein
VLDLRKNSDGDIAGAAEQLCEQYLTGIFRYVNYRVNDTELAEELTLNALLKALSGIKHISGQDSALLVRLFKTARNEVRDYLRSASFEPVLSGLSSQEQEVFSLKFGAALNNKIISEILGLSEPGISRILNVSLRKLNGSPGFSK